MTEFLRKKNKTRTFSHCAWSNSIYRWHGKGDKFGSSIEGSKNISVCVTPHPSLKTPPPYNNKRDYKGDTLDKTLDPHKHDSDV